MKRSEELALIRVVLEIGRKVSALSVDASRSPGMHWETADEHELLVALHPLRRILDDAPKLRKRT